MKILFFPFILLFALIIFLFQPYDYPLQTFEATLSDGCVYTDSFSSRRIAAIGTTTITCADKEPVVRRDLAVPGQGVPWFRLDQTTKGYWFSTNLFPEPISVFSYEPIYRRSGLCYFIEDGIHWCGMEE